MSNRRVTLGPVGEKLRANIRECRMKRDMTQAELAHTAGLPSQAVTEIEVGTRRVTVDDLVALSTALRVSVARLIGKK